MKIINIVVLLLCIGMIYLLFFKKEKMTADANTKKLIQDHYKIDVDAIRNLSKLANDLTKNGKLRIPGGLEVDGNLNIAGKSRFMGPLDVHGLTHLRNELAIHNGNNRGITHFNNQNKGLNYIRGDIALDGHCKASKNLNVYGKSKFSGELVIHNGNNKGITHFNHQKKGENYINGKNFINGLSTNKLHSTKGKIGGYAINCNGSTVLLWEGEWFLNSGTEDGALVNPKTETNKTVTKQDNVFMNSCTNDSWDIIYLYPGWKIDVWRDYFSGPHRNFENKRKDGLPIRLHLGFMGLADRVSSYKLSWVNY